MAFSASLRRLTTLIGLLGVLFSSLTGCSSGSGGVTPNPLPTGDEPNMGRGANGIDNLADPGARDVCRANAAVSGRAKWTVLIYMNAANDLQPDSLTNMAQIASIGSSPDVNIVVQWKQAACANCGSPSFVETRRYRVTPHSSADVASIQRGVTSVLDNDLLAPPPAPFYNSGTKQADMGDYRVLNDFVKWGSSTYPADHLAVVLWNHGAGWKPTRTAGGVRPPRFRAFSEDDDTRNEIQTTQIPVALSGTSQPIDDLIFDCSLMQMIEVAYEVRNSAKLLVGSEESPPGSGYPYDLWLSDLKTGGAGANPCALGRSIVNTFVSYYRNNFSYNNITQSVIDLTKMQNVADKLDAFASQLRLHTSIESTALQVSRTTAQRYDYPENKDLADYADLVRTKATSQPLKDSATSLLSALRGGVTGSIIYNGFGAFGQDKSYGQAIYIQQPSDFNPRYYDISLSKPGGAPNWAKFLTEQRQ